MRVFDWIQVCVWIGVSASLVPLLGAYLSKVFRGETTFLHRLLNPVEILSYRFAGINPDQEMNWKTYTRALLLFNFFGFLTLFLVLLLQNFLPLNPQKFGSVPWDLAFNTAISFVTNTNWQAYSGETTMSYATQMCGFTVQNFLSAATGNAALLALIRGITRKTSLTIGNFWVDLVRTVIYLLIPLACVFALFLVSQGVIQSLAPYEHITTLEQHTQIIPLGPVASQIAIKQLGTNGGGFFATNSAHPFENPNSLTNFLELLSIVLIPTSVIYMYGSLTGAKKHGWLLLLAMTLLWALGVGLSFYAESISNPLFDVFPNWEGKEIRFGVLPSLVWSVSTTATANGSVDAMLTSLSPLAGAAALLNILLGELIFGGVGVGLCTLVIFVLLTIFLSGLMVGKTPEYMGKKIEKKEMLWVSLAILTPATLILIGSALTSYAPDISGVKNAGPHGLTGILYAFASTAFNNGSSFEGLLANSPFFNVIFGICMLIGRLSIIIPTLAIAGSLAQKKSSFSSGAFSTNTALFISILLGVILIIGALTYFPALSLGPLMEHFLMLKGEAFG